MYEYVKTCYKDNEIQVNCDILKCFMRFFYCQHLQDRLNVVLSGLPPVYIICDVTLDYMQTQKCQPHTLTWIHDFINGDFK